MYRTLEVSVFLFASFNSWTNIHALVLCDVVHFGMWGGGTKTKKDEEMRKKLLLNYSGRNLHRAEEEGGNCLDDVVPLPDPPTLSSATRPLPAAPPASVSTPPPQQRKQYDHLQCFIMRDDAIRVFTPPERENTSTSDGDADIHHRTVPLRRDRWRLTCHAKLFAVSLQSTSAGGSIVHRSRSGGDGLFSLIEPSHQQRHPPPFYRRNPADGAMSAVVSAYLRTPKRFSRSASPSRRDVEDVGGQSAASSCGLLFACSLVALMRDAHHTRADTSCSHPSSTTATALVGGCASAHGLISEWANCAMEMFGCCGDVVPLSFLSSVNETPAAAAAAVSSCNTSGRERESNVRRDTRELTRNNVTRCANSNNTVLRDPPGEEVCPDIPSSGDARECALSVLVPLVAVEQASQYFSSEAVTEKKGQQDRARSLLALETDDPSTCSSGRQSKCNSEANSTTGGAAVDVLSQPHLLSLIRESTRASSNIHPQRAAAVRSLACATALIECASAFVLLPCAMVHQHTATAVVLHTTRCTYDDDSVGSSAHPVPPLVVAPMDLVYVVVAKRPSPSPAAPEAASGRNASRLPASALLDRLLGAPGSVTPGITLRAALPSVIGLSGAVNRDRGSAAHEPPSTSHMPDRKKPHGKMLKKPIAAAVGLLGSGGASGLRRGGCRRHVTTEDLVGDGGVERETLAHMAAIARREKKELLREAKKRAREGPSMGRECVESDASEGEGKTGGEFPAEMFDERQYCHTKHR